MKSKRGEFNFVLLFAIIAGAAILVLSIYGAVKSASWFKLSGDAESSVALSSVLDPLQSGSYGAVASSITFRKETLILNDCDSYDGFGSNSISTQTESAIRGDFINPIKIGVSNKYIFSQEEAGKYFRVFSLPFDTSFRVSDIIVVSSLNYCFIFPPEEIEENILSMRMSNFQIRNSDNNTCDDDSINVCFGYGQDCDVLVNGMCKDCDSEYEYGVVERSDGDVIYSGNLIYPAITTSKDLYECNVRRLLFRAGMVANIYSQKSDYMNMRGCGTLLKSSLVSFSNMLLNADVKDLHAIYVESKNLDSKVRLDRSECELW